MSTLLSVEDQVIVALRRITRAIDLHSRGLMQQFGLTAPQLASLQAIERLQPITGGQKLIPLMRQTVESPPSSESVISLRQIPNLFRDGEIVYLANSSAAFPAFSVQTLRCLLGTQNRLCPCKLT